MVTIKVREINSKCLYLTDNLVIREGVIKKRFLRDDNTINYYVAAHKDQVDCFSLRTHNQVYDSMEEVLELLRIDYLKNKK